MKKTTFIIICLLLSASYSHAFMQKPLYTVVESTGNGIVYMTDDEFYLSGEHNNTMTSEAKDYSELRKRFQGEKEEGADYPTTECSLYLYSKADSGYGLLGFTESKNDNGVYADSDFVLDANGKRAVSGSCVNVDDPNQPWIEIGSDEPFVVGDLSLYSETPNKHYYAVFTNVPDFGIEDGVDMGQATESPTNTYTVTYTRHLNAGWNAVYLPCAFDVEEFKTTVEGGEVYMIMAYIKSSNQLLYGTGMKQVEACAPLLIYSPVDYDLEFAMSDQAITFDSSVNTSILEESAAQSISGTFTNKTVAGKCYNLDFDGTEFVFKESDNILTAFRFAFVFDDDSRAPASKRIPLNLKLGDATDIQVMGNIASQSNQIYTLDGRPLNAEPVSGIYIRNGKKIIR